MNMSQWPDSRDYGDLDSGTKNSDWSKPKEPPKTVRCVIDKELTDGLYRLGSGDCAHPVQPKREGTRIVSNNVESIRLKNHLQWKKQKEIEYLRKREAERLEEERKKEEKRREEKEKRRKEKEREERIREWQEQKAKEKEERKREESVLKALEQEIKGVTQTIDKEKLIHEWIRLKNKQKQLEAEKKAALLKKEEEARSLRQALADISYRQWKEKTKNRRIALPKNGYQIFGPKPDPVVKEDWNHDFIRGDTEDKGISARTPKSALSLTSIRGSSVSRTDFNTQPLLNEVKKRSPSSCHLTITRSKTSLNEYDGRPCDPPFRELQIPEIDTTQRWRRVESFISHQEETRLRNLQQEKGNKSVHVHIPNGFSSKINPKLLNMPITDMLPTKNKIDIYLRTADTDATTINDKLQKNKNKLVPNVPDDNLKKYLQSLSDVNTKLLIDLNEKLSSNQIKNTSSRNTVNVPVRKCSKEVNGEKKLEKTNEFIRRSRSCDKPNRKPPMNRSLSMTTEDKSKKTDTIKKSKKVTIRLVEKSQKPEPEVKLRKKPRKSQKPEPILLEGSPYCSKRTRTKNKGNKVKE